MTFSGFQRGRGKVFDGYEGGGAPSPAGGHEIDENVPAVLSRAFQLGPSLPVATLVDVPLGSV